MNNNENKPGRHRAKLLALIVALIGLTIAPGFTCTAEMEANGTKRVTVSEP